MLKRMMSIALVMALVLGLAGTATAGPVSYWQFDEDGTDPQDCVSNIDLTRLYGGRSILYAANPIPNPDKSTWRSGEGDPAENIYSVFKPQFYRVTDDFRMLDTRSWTLEGWFRRNPADGNEGALDTGFGEQIANTRNTGYTWTSGWSVMLNAAGNLVFRLDTGLEAKEIMTATSVVDAQWHHFAVTWDHGTGTNGYVQLYLDGVLADDSTGLGTLNESGDQLFTIGYRQFTDPSNKFLGRLDEFRWTYDEVLEPWQFLNGSGEPPVVSMPIAEPAGLGLLGLALLGLRKRRN
jgi:MYXO-CTERM domain-containing protein